MDREGIPVLSHIGLIPTFSHMYGGLRAFGRKAEEAMQIWETLKRMEDVGVFAVEAEYIAEEVLTGVNLKTSIVTFSLGSGPGGDAVFSFVADVCGEASEEEKPPKHAHAFGNVGRLRKQIHEERVAALSEFHQETRAKNFPDAATNIGMQEGEEAKLLEALDAWTPTHQYALTGRATVARKRIIPASQQARYSAEPLACAMQRAKEQAASRNGEHEQRRRRDRAGPCRRSGWHALAQRYAVRELLVRVGPKLAGPFSCGLGPTRRPRCVKGASCGGIRG